MTAPFLLVTEAHAPAANLDEILAHWSELSDGAALYRGVESTSVVELTPVPDLAQLDSCVAAWWQLYESLQPLLSGDVRRQVLSFVTAVKPVAEQLPDSTYVQLRHVEVKPPVHQEYLEWREDTIFAEVRKNDLIEGFLAYHSLLSTEPGVLFVSGFSCPPEEYLPTFATERYAEIGRQAHPRFVTDAGLYTRIYQRVKL